jgi:hypothetical protein
VSGVEIVRRHPVIAYFVLTNVLTWWMLPLLKVSPLLGLFGLFGPPLRPSSWLPRIRSDVLLQGG